MSGNQEKSKNLKKISEKLVLASLLINRLTSKIPMFGSSLSKWIYLEGIGHSRNPLRRKIFTVAALLFYVNMVHLHVEFIRNSITNLSIKLPEKKPIEKELYLIFIFIFNLVNVMIIISQTYLINETFKNTSKYIELRKRNFFKNSGINEDFQLVDLDKFIKYLSEKAYFGHSAREDFAFLVGKEAADNLLNSFEKISMEHLDKFSSATIPRESAMGLLHMLNDISNSNLFVRAMQDLDNGQWNNRFSFTFKDILGFIISNVAIDIAKA